MAVRVDFWRQGLLVGSVWVLLVLKVALLLARWSVALLVLSLGVQSVLLWVQC